MKITKSNWVTDNDKIRLSMPVSKIDVENRLVSGFATLDNIDLHGDVVTAEASRSAFSRFRGNIREMHQPIAAGHMVDFNEDEYFNQSDGQFYRGIYVTAYISKGAQDTWEKINDGTLTAFSIGGEIVDSKSEWVKDAGRTVRFIKDYELVELSLVDNPANQLANVFSITKTADGQVVEGMVAETILSNVFWCDGTKEPDTHEAIAKASESDSETCQLCRNPMVNIGWFEQTSDKKADKMQEVVNKFLGTVTKATDNNEGGVGVPEDENTTDETVEAVEDVDTDEVEADDATDEGAADVDDVEVDDGAVLKSIDDLKAAVEEALAKTATLATSEAVHEVGEQIAKVNSAFEEKTSEFAKKFEELDEKISSIKGSSEKVSKRLDALESLTAIKKSGDETPDTVHKSADTNKTWKGAFIPVDRV